MSQDQPEIRFPQPSEPSEPLPLFGELLPGPLASRFVSREQAAAWLGGFVDGEGSVVLTTKSRDRRRAKRSYFWERYIEFSNTDPSLIEASRDALTVLGIRHAVYTPKRPKNPNWSQAWIVIIRGRQELQKFAELVPIQAGHKKAVLARALATYSNLPRYTNRGRR
jgi:hypothetical protein